MELFSALGDKLRFGSMAAMEEMSRLFEYQVIAVASNDDAADITADKLLGKPFAIGLIEKDYERWFHGLVAAFGFHDRGQKESAYSITVRPWAWLLTRSADVRIFQEKSAPDIIKQVFSEYPAAAFVDELTGSYKPRTYCVQYRETDFNFVSRLMEEEGIFYFWRHTKDKHELVLADKSTVHKQVVGFSELRYAPNLGGLVDTSNDIQEWHMRREIQTGKYTLSDYDFEKPGTSLKSSTATSTRSHAEGSHEVYDYPGLYTVKGDGDARAQIRLDEASAGFTRATGVGDTAGLVAGTRFKLTEHGSDNGDYLVLRTQIDMQQPGYSTGTDTSKYRCRFVAQPYADPFRPARMTPKPVVAGPQTAQVVGGGGAGDIETDKYGRIKVQFHWDRLGKKNAESSCWLRVATSWAGKGWGMISLPRIGQEVVVAFLEGDPDRPLVVGSVYNAEQEVPYELPANATVSTLKSRSKKGGAKEFNELRFEDKPGEEYVLMQAQKDRLEFVEETLKSEIGKDEHRTVKMNRKEKIEGEHHLQVVKDVKHKIDGKLSTTVAQDMLFKTNGLHSLEAAQDITAKSGTAYSIKAGTDLHVKVGMNTGVDSGMNVHVKGGVTVVVEAGVMITLKAGPASVVLGPDGVSITGPMVKINSGGSPGAGSGASPVAPTSPDAPEAPELPKDPLSHR
jgi:type VI secretion system secreted protein VgrG